MILLFGAEFTRVYAEKHGSRIGAEPQDVDPNAKTLPDPKTEVAGSNGQPASQDEPARVPTTRGDVRPQAPPQPHPAPGPRPAGRPL